MPLLPSATRTVTHALKCTERPRIGVEFSLNGLYSCPRQIDAACANSATELIGHLVAGQSWCTSVDPVGMRFPLVVSPLLLLAA